MAKRALDRWGDKSVECISEETVTSVPKKARTYNAIPINTLKTQRNVWSQFTAFCESRHYQLTPETGVEQLATVLQDWAFNMKKSDGQDYKESVVKTMWNIAAKLLQEKYAEDFSVSFNPFKDIAFKEARDARDAKRRELKFIPEKRKLTAEGFTKEELNDVCNIWDEATPNGLQRKFYHLAATQLEWKAGEGAWATLEHFIPEKDDSGNETGMIEYNASFSKTTPGSAKSKWLTPNLLNPDHCPVRLFHELKRRRPSTIKTNRLFLTPNPYWQIAQSKAWYKNMPIGRNEVAKWTKQAAEKIGIDTKLRKITNRFAGGGGTIRGFLAGFPKKYLLTPDIDESEATTDIEDQEELPEREIPEVNTEQWRSVKAEVPEVVVEQLSPVHPVKTEIPEVAEQSLPNEGD